MMHCPKCPSETLVESKYLGDLPLDHCPSCGGIWFDKGELEALLRQSQGGAAADLNLLMPKPAGADCIRCRGKLQRGGLVNPLLLVDKCPDCGGVWLDARELDLLRKLLGFTGGPSAENRVQRPPAAPAQPAAQAPGFRPLPLASIALGALGLAYQVRTYLNAAEMPSMLVFFVITLICLSLFSYGVFALLQKAAPGDRR